VLKGPNTAKELGSLGYFSPWLEEFQPRGGFVDLEIPGQYNGSAKPRPENHVRIAGFKSEVKPLTPEENPWWSSFTYYGLLITDFVVRQVSVMPSIRLPVRVTMIGSDAREYPFLVKGGEDLRQDERVQQLLSLMNKILQQNQACKNRQFSISTYKVSTLKIGGFPLLVFVPPFVADPCRARHNTRYLT